MWQKMLDKMNNKTVLIIVAGVVVLLAIIAYACPDCLKMLMEKMG